MQKSKKLEVKEEKSMNILHHYKDDIFKEQEW